MARVTYSLLEEILVGHDSRFVMCIRHEVGAGDDVERREPPHRMLHHPDIGGTSRHLPVRFDGEDKPIGARTLRAIVRRFELPTDIFDRTDQGGGSPS